MKTKPTWIASAKPKEHIVKIGKRRYVYSHIRKRELSNEMVFYKMLHQVAKVTLRTVKEIFNIKT